MDCEGCEFDVIPHLQDELFNKISIIIMEYHDYPHDIIKILKGHSFRITYEENRKSGLLFAENRTKVIK